MITPEYLEKVADAFEVSVAELNEYLTKNIVKQIITTFDKIGDVQMLPSSISDFHKLIDLGNSITEIQTVIEEYLPQIQKEVKKVFEESAKELSKDLWKEAKAIIRTVDPDGKVISKPIDNFENSGLPKEAKDLKLTKPEIRQLETAYRRTNGEVYNLTRSTAERAQRAYFKACDTAYNKTKAGVSMNKAIEEAISEVASNGMDTVEYPTGHTDRMEVAIARAIRTGMNQANANIVLTRNAEMGVNYVLVSEHWGARVTGTEDYRDHSWWQGQVYSVNWRSINENYNGETLKQFADMAKEGDKRFPFLKETREYLQKNDKYKDRFPDFESVTGYGDILGLCGVNCRHTFSPFYPGAQKIPERNVDDDEKNEKMYENSQRQRILERRIRKTKREVAALKLLQTEEGQKALKRKENLLYRQLDTYNDFCRENNLSRANWRIKAN